MLERQPYRKLCWYVDTVGKCLHTHTYTSKSYKHYSSICNTQTLHTFSHTLPTLPPPSSPPLYKSYQHYPYSSLTSLSILSHTHLTGGWVRDKLLGKGGHEDIDIALDNMNGANFATILNAWYRKKGTSIFIWLNLLKVRVCVCVRMCVFLWMYTFAFLCLYCVVFVIKEYEDVINKLV